MNLMKHPTESLKGKPISLHHAAAEYYFWDALDFLGRFKITNEKVSRKTAKIKSFTDLLFGCECILKCHIIISSQEQSIGDLLLDMKNKYKHNIKELAATAKYAGSENIYLELSESLRGFNVRLRYSMDADAASSLGRPSCNEFEYTQTIGSKQWIENIAKLLEILINDIRCEFVGLVSQDVRAHLAYDENILTAVRKPNKARK